MNVWLENIDSEADFWVKWLTDAEFEEVKNRRLAAIKENLPQFYLDLVDLKAGQTIRLIDVGSGPISTIPRFAQNHPVELICTDALAIKYNKMLIKYGLEEHANILNIKGEELETYFGPNRFHIVNCANALDHFVEPEIALGQMWRVCMNKGAVVVLSIENEAERENYSGLHQWNLQPSKDGLHLWNNNIDKNIITGEMRSGFSFEYVDHGQKGFKIFRAILRKNLHHDS